MDKTLKIINSASLLEEEYEEIEVREKKNCGERIIAVSDCAWIFHKESEQGMNIWDDFLLGCEAYGNCGHVGKNLGGQILFLKSIFSVQISSRPLLSPSSRVVVLIIKETRRIARKYDTCKPLKNSVKV